MIDRTEADIMKKWDMQMLDTPAVSVRCLAYNHEKYIEQCLDGFLMQETTFSFEVVIHDDASTDHTADIIRKYEKIFPHILKPIYETENQYSKGDGSLGRIIDAAIRGKYTAVCEGDDYWTDPKKLQLQYEAMEQNPECTIAFHRVEFVNIDREKLGITAPSSDAGFSNGAIITLKDFCHEEYGRLQWCFHTSSFFYRSDTKTVDEWLIIFPWGDMRRILFSLSHGKGYFIDRKMSCYRVLSGGYNSEMLKNPSADVANRNRVIRGLQTLDQMTNGKYHDDIAIRIKREEYLIHQRRREFISLLSPRYSVVAPFKSRVSSSLQILAPNLHQWLLDKYHKMQE